MSTSRSAYCVLGCLSSGPKSGYDIRLMMREVTGFFWKESDGQLYPALKRLMESGMIQQVGESGSRKKKVYQITETGRSYLRDWLVLPTPGTQVRSEFMLKMFLSNELRYERVMEHLRREKAQIAERLGRFNEIGQSLEGHGGNPRVVEAWRMVMDAGVELAQAELRWCERSMTAIQEKLNTEAFGP